MALVTHMNALRFSMCAKGRTHTRRFASRMGTLLRFAHPRKGGC